jgi:transcriptional regulator with XRE-family HTH domain
MARAALNWTVRNLAQATGLHRNTITNIEVGRYVGDQKSLELIEGVLRKAGIEFIDDGGVRLRKGQGIGFGEPTPLFKDSPVKRLNISNHMVRVSGEQIRAARALVRWSAADLAGASALGVNTIRRAEIADEGTVLTAANELAIRRALEVEGVVFIDENGGGPGVRLRKRLKGKSRKK